MQGAAKPRAGLRPRDSNVPVVSAQAPAERKSRRSMSQVLQDRSEVAVSGGVPKQPVVCPPSPLPDIDSCDKEDPLAATDFVADIFSYYKRMEPLLRVSPDYMAHQVWGKRLEGRGSKQQQREQQQEGAAGVLGRERSCGVLLSKHMPAGSRPDMRSKEICPLLLPAPR